MPPQTNATITKVAGAGTRDDWDRPAAAGPDKWLGEVRGYYSEKLRRLVVDGATQIVNARTLVLDTTDFDGMALDTDDVVTFTPDGQAQSTGQAQAISRAALDAIPRELQTTRIELDPT